MNHIPRFEKLTTKQKKALPKASELWDTFVYGDQGLIGSNCGCCKSKRHTIYKVIGRTR